MPGHDIIVIGASAGGVETLVRLVRDLPGDLPVAVLITLHVAPHVPSLLPEILSRAGPLRAVHPRDGDAIERGRIYCALPDQHLLVGEGDRIRLSMGPRENSHRPAADPLFRSAAVYCGPRVVGVVLTGNLDDGTAGLIAIKRQGGVTIVQNPTEALFPSMPLSAIEKGDVDQVLHVKDIGEALVRLAYGPVTRLVRPVPVEMKLEADIAAMNPPAFESLDRPGVSVPVSCPDCDGTLFELKEGGVTRYRCRVGHAFSMETLLNLQSDVIERALWSAMVALKEKAAVIRKVLEFSRERGHERSAARFEEQAKMVELQAGQIQALLNRRVGGSASMEEMPGESSSAAA